MSLYLGCRSGNELSIVEQVLGLGRPDVNALSRERRIYEYPNKINDMTIYAGVGFDGTGSVYEFDKRVLVRWAQPVEGCVVASSAAELSAELGIELSQGHLQYLDQRLFRARYRSPFDWLAISTVVFLERDEPRTKRAILDEKEHWVKRLKMAAEEEKECADEDDCCVICQEHAKSVIITPCLHQCLCATCGKALLDKEDVDNLCPVCREPIEKLLHPIK